MGTHTGSVLTLANSIIGVSVLAMPFCFKQCGIILSIVLLILSNVVTRLACYYLIKSAIMEKRKNFEMLAFRVLGRSGKLIVELCIIGFMLGTCVAFFVVVGDLGPTILAEVIGVEHPSALRPSVLIGLGVFVVLPLGLLRNVESLSTLCAASIAFYVCLVLKVMGEATSHLLAWDWMDKVSFWRPSGVLQCIPIFSMALSCQTQLFEVFDSLPSTPMERMNSIIRSAINMTTTFYIAVGFFGYVAFCNQPFTGNLLINLSPSVVSYIIKLGFILSVAVSFPLVIFPCRASIYSLIFTSGSLMPGGEASSHIPETKFQCITLLIVTLSLVTGLLVPSIEAVLSFVGSTIGVFVCIILPSIIFICLSKKNTSERLLAKVLASLGLLTMILSTYANLTAVDSALPEVDFSRELPVVLPPLHESLNGEHQPIELPEKMLKPEQPKKLSVREEDMKKLKDVDELKELVLPKLKEAKNEKLKEKLDISDDKKEINSRKEPPNPVPEEPKIPPKKKKTVLVPPLSKTDVKKIETKIDIEEIKRKIEKLDIPKSAEAERVEEIVTPKYKKIETNVSLSELLKESKVLKKSVLAESIANRVPLPLAVKGNLDIPKDIVVRKEEAKDREKRDTETELALEKKESSNVKAIIDSTNDKVNLLNNMDSGLLWGNQTNGVIDDVEVKSNDVAEVKAETLLVNEGNDKSSVKQLDDGSSLIKVLENDKSSVKQLDDGSSFIKVLENEVKQNTDEEKCPKNNTVQKNIPALPSDQNQIDANLNSSDLHPVRTVDSKEIKPLESDLNQSQNVIELNLEKSATESPSIELIKTPTYLSDPNLIFDSKKIIHGPEPKLNIESNPLKRDLKSVQESLENNKIDHR